MHILEAEHRPHVLVLSKRSLRQDCANLSKQVACWRCEATRARADLQLAEQDTTKHGKKGYFAKEHFRLDRCLGPRRSLVDRRL